MNLSEVFAELGHRTFIHRSFTESPTIGLHAAFYKVHAERSPEAEQLLRNEARDRKIDRLIREKAGASERLATGFRTLATGPEGYPSPEVVGSRSLFPTIGYWDWLVLEYANDFAGMTKTPSSPSILGQKSFYGYLLATNSEVVDGRVVDGPFASEDTGGRAGRAAGVFAHYKFNPLLLFTGRSDLILHTAQFIALLVSASDELWRSELARRAWEWVLRPTGVDASGPPISADEIERIVEPIREQARGVKFLVYQNLGWDDLSVYLMGAPLDTLAQLALFLREMPICFPRWVYQVKAAMLEPKHHQSREYRRHAPACRAALGGVLSVDEARAAAETFERLVDRCRRLHNEAGRKPHWNPEVRARALVPELPVFCDYTDVFTVSTEASDEVRYLQMMNSKPGRIGDLDQTIGGTRSGKLSILSGPVDFLHLLSKDELPDIQEEHDRFVHGKKSYALVPLPTDAFYRPRIDRGSIFSSISLLFEEEFGHRDWDKVERILNRLEVPRNIREALRNVVLSHLAFKNDPIMVNSLVDYLTSWKNLQRQLLDELSTINTGLNTRPTLIKNLTTYVEKVGQTISTRYHSSSRMFEVVDLNPLHRGGIDVFLNAYSQLRHLALKAFRFIDHDSHGGIVKVGYGNTVHVYGLFGSIVELDWLRLSNPENGFVIFHELGHQVLRDKVLGPLTRVLNQPTFWRSITDLGRYPAEVEHAEGWASFSVVRDIFADVFCDLFMLQIVIRSLSEEDDRSGLRDFYDRWFWTQAEIHLNHHPHLHSSYLYLQLIRWYCVSQTLDKWDLVPELLGSEKLASLEAYLVGVEARRQEEAEIQEQLLKKTMDEHLLGYARETMGKGKSSAEDSQPSFHPFQDLTSFELVEMPDSQAEWDELLERRVARYSLSVRKRLHPETACSQGCDGCDSADQASCRRFCWDTYGLLCSYLRPFDDVDENAAQGFILLARTFLEVLSRPDARAELRPVNEMYRLGQDVFDAVFQGDGELESYVCFDDEGRIEDSRGQPYAPAVVNPRGSIILLDPLLRNRVFGKRLEIFLDLARDRLERLARELVER
jgi:hypothetical protein